jgi:hypothetical protein
MDGAADRREFRSDWLVCEECWLTLQTGLAVRCSSCGARYHVECWEAVGGCLSPGCPEAVAAEEKDERAKPVEKGIARAGRFVWADGVDRVTGRGGSGLPPSSATDRASRPPAKLVHALGLAAALALVVALVGLVASSGNRASPTTKVRSHHATPTSNPAPPPSDLPLPLIALAPADQSPRPFTQAFFFRRRRTRPTAVFASLLPPLNPQGGASPPATALPRPPTTTTTRPPPPPTTTTTTTTTTRPPPPPTTTTTTTLPPTPPTT